MPILKIYEGQALKAALNEIASPMRVTYLALDEPQPDTIIALDDLAALTPHLSVTVKPDPTAEADRVIVQGEQGAALAFVGAPVGTELAALVSAIVVAGRGQSGLAPETRQALAELTRPVHMEVFTTPT